MKCELLDAFGIWGKMELDKSDFKFECYYTKEDKNIQLWRGKNGDLFILKEVEE